MNLESLVHRVEARLADLGRRLLPPGPGGQVREEAEDLATEVSNRRAALAHFQQEREATRQRLEDNEVTAALLPSQIEGCVRRGRPDQAWPLALELDRVRRALSDDRAALPRLEQTCWSLEFHLRILERRLDHLRGRAAR